MSNATMKNEADAILNWYKGSAYTGAPTTLYAALLTANPTKNDGTGLVECSDSAYARQPITCSTGWSAVSQSGDNIHDQISNAAAITFPNCAGAGYTVVGLAIYDAVTAGNLKRAQSVTSQAVSTGNGYQIAIGGLVIEI